MKNRIVYSAALLCFMAGANAKDFNTGDFKNYKTGEIYGYNVKTLDLNNNEDNTVEIGDSNDTIYLLQNVKGKSLNVYGGARFILCNANITDNINIFGNNYGLFGNISVGQQNNSASNMNVDDMILSLIANSETKAGLIAANIFTNTAIFNRAANFYDGTLTAGESIEIKESGLKNGYTFNGQTTGEGKLKYGESLETLKYNTLNKLYKQLENSKANVDDLNKKIETLTNAQTEADKKAKELENKLQQDQAALEQAKEALKKAQDDLKSKEETLTKAQAEADKKANELEEKNKQLQQVQAALEQAKETLKKEKDDLEQAKNDAKAKVANFEENGVKVFITRFLDIKELCLDQAYTANVVAALLFKPKAFLKDFNLNNPKAWIIDFKDVKTENFTEEAKKHFEIKEEQNDTGKVKFLVKKQQN